MTWVDTTAYRQGEPSRIPRTWTLQLTDLRIVVTRHRDYAAETWVMLAYPVLGAPRELKSGEIDAAKSEALEIVRHWLRRSLDEVDGAAA